MKLLIIILVTATGITLATLAFTNPSPNACPQLECVASESEPAPRFAALFTDSRAFQVHFFNIIELFARQSKTR